MKEKLQNKIFSAFPSLYCRKDLKPMETCMCWGIETGDGWFDLIYNLSRDIVAINKNVRADQVKEKFGGLRFYWSIDGDYTDADINKLTELIEKAEDDSYKICEGCGSTENVTQTHGWVVTLCGECMKERNNRIAG